MATDKAVRVLRSVARHAATAAAVSRVHAVLLLELVMAAMLGTQWSVDKGFFL